MILPNMTDDEKCFEAFRVTPMADSILQDNRKMILDKFRRGTKFPYTQRFSFDDDRHNRWYIVVACRSKKAFKKDCFTIICYTIYEVYKRKADGNSGKGIIFFDPTKNIDYIRASEEQRKDMVGAMYYEVVPHCFNRYRQRYLAPKGLDGIDFYKQVESVINHIKHFDVMGDESANKHGEYPIDMIMDDGGLLRGQFINNCFTRFYTYVSREMLFENQEENSKAMLKEYYEWVRKGIYK